MARIQFLFSTALIGWAATALPALAQYPSAPAAASVPSTGKQVFGKWCSDCHSTAGGPGSLALQRKYHGDVPAILEQRTNLPSEYVTYVVRHGVSFMPSFRKTEISNEELALVAAYLAPSQGKAH